MKKEETLQEIVIKLNDTLTDDLLKQGVGLSYITNGDVELLEYAGEIIFREDDMDYDTPLLPQVLDGIRKMAETLTKFSKVIDKEWRK